MFQPRTGFPLSAAALVVALSGLPAGYAGATTGVGPGGKWRFNADVGAAFQGKPKVRLVHTGCTAVPVACAMLARDVADEQNALADDLDALRVYPVLRVGVSYPF